MAPRPFSKDPISLSYSGWKRYNECPQKHFLVMSGYRPKYSDERNFLNGQVLHKVLERWFANDEPASWIAEQAEPVWHEYVGKKYILFKSDGDKKELLAKCIAWGARLAGQVVELGIDKATTRSELNLERMFAVAGHRVRLHGYLDVVALTLDGDQVVMDLKCSASRGVMDPYQMVFYSVLLEDVDRPRHTAFILPALDDIVAFTVQEEHRRWLVADLERVAQQIIADQFDPDPENANCHWCEVKAACPVMGGAPVTRGRQILT